MAVIYTRGGHTFCVDRSRVGVYEDSKTASHLTYRLQILDRAGGAPRRSRKSVTISVADIVAAEGE